MLAEPVSQQSVAGTARYPMRQAGAGAATALRAVCHHDPNRLHPGQLAAVGVASWPHPCLPVSTVPDPHMFPPDLLQELVSLLAPDTATSITVFSPLVQHCQQEAASTKLVSPKFQSPLLSLSKLMDVKTSSGSRPVAVANLLVSSDHWLADLGWLAGQRSSAFPSLASSSSPPSSQQRTRLWRTCYSRGRP